MYMCVYDELYNICTFISTNCFEDINNVRCYFIAATALITDSPYDTQVRLIQGGTNFTSSGFVEVYMNNRWGPVCNMDKEAADTACRQLGYTEASTYNDYSGLM